MKVGERGDESERAREREREREGGRPLPRFARIVPSALTVRPNQLIRRYEIFNTWYSRIDEQTPESQGLARSIWGLKMDHFVKL